MRRDAALSRRAARLIASDTGPTRPRNIAAIVTASVALLLMNFSKSSKTVDESRAWLKRIAISWVVLNGLGFILAYVTPFFSGGRWNG